MICILAGLINMDFTWLFIIGMVKLLNALKLPDMRYFAYTGKGFQGRDRNTTGE